MQLHQALLGTAEALLIGFLIGAQREASRDESEQQAGVRDFTLIALVGAFCALIDSDWVIAAAVLAIAGLLTVYYHHTAGRSGITTEIAAVATFFLGYLAATNRVPNGTLLAVALAVTIIFVLGAKHSLHAFVRKTITLAEFYDSIRFLALVFVIYPVLPKSPMGPYGFFDARKVWLFIVLVCSVSYFGYFFSKFTREKNGMKLAGILGGIASSTASTAAFARFSRTSDDEGSYGAGSAAIANALQFPRILLLLYFFDAQVEQACQWILLAMTAAGVVVAVSYWRGAAPALIAQSLMRNPLSLRSALNFGALLTVILFLSKASLAAFGRQAVQWVGAIAGFADADAVLLSAAELHRQGGITTSIATGSVLLALAANAVTKGAIAATGTQQFARRVLVALGAMFGTGGAVWLACSLPTGR